MTHNRPCLGTPRHRCPQLTRHPTGRCDTCRGITDRQRGTTTQRGYGTDHRNLRADLKPTVQTGQTKCWRCNQPIRPSEPWDLGHDDHNRNIYRGPEHTDCNRGRRPRAAPRT